ncbi:hypothetical protein D3C85_1205760 [compost metagenome]
MGRVQIGIAGLGIEQDGAHDGFQVAARALAVVVEHGGHAADVGGTGITGHHPLDELHADERRHVWVRADDVHGALERQVAVGAGRNDGAQEALLGHRMQRIVQRHGPPVEFHVRLRTVDVPAREHLGQALHVRVGIGLHRRALDHPDGAVLLQLQEADAE